MTILPKVARVGSARVGATRVAFTPTNPKTGGFVPITSVTLPSTSTTTVLTP